MPLSPGFTAKSGRRAGPCPDIHPGRILEVQHALIAADQRPFHQTPVLQPYLGIGITESSQNGETLERLYGEIHLPGVGVRRAVQTVDAYRTPVIFLVHDNLGGKITAEVIKTEIGVVLEAYRDVEGDIAAVGPGRRPVDIMPRLSTTTLGERVPRPPEARMTSQSAGDHFRLTRGERKRP